MLSKVTRGVVETPHLIMIAGTDGCGKSFFGASAPNPVFIGLEAGTNQLDVARFPSPKTWGEVEQAIGELISEPHDFKTLVIDSVDWLEPLVFAAVCTEAGVANIEKVDGGYGRGYAAALTKWKRLTELLTDLRTKRSMNVILIGHVEVAKHSDPTLNVDYDRYTLKLNKKAAALLREYVDCVLFAKYETFTKKDGQKHRAIGDGARVMFTEWRPAFDAKNRFGLPFQLPLSWEAYDQATKKPAAKTISETKAELTDLLSQIKDDDLRAKVIDTVEKAGNDLTKLLAIKNRVQVRLGAMS
jgi:hypothetical protein